MGFLERLTRKTRAKKTISTTTTRRNPVPRIIHTTGTGVELGDVFPLYSETKTPKKTLTHKSSSYDLLMGFIYASSEANSI